MVGVGAHRAGALRYKILDPKTTNTDAAIKAAAEATRAAEEARKNFRPPKTPWGEPDVRGYFLNLSYTPLERPKELGDKALYTPEEALAAFKKAVEEDAEVNPRTVHYDWKEARDGRLAKSYPAQPAYVAYRRSRRWTNPDDDAGRQEACGGRGAWHLCQQPWPVQNGA